MELFVPSFLWLVLAESTMAAYMIHPLNLGTITRDTSSMAYMTNPGVKVTLPVFAWYVTDGRRKILIDTGGITPDGVRFMPYTQTEAQKLPNALRALGVECGDIDTVILTHLHWDHASNNQLFPKAKIVVQAKELRYAAAPLPCQLKSYDAKLIFQSDYTVVDGDHQLFDGISLVFTPGHSPGSQCVVIDTTAGKYCVAGDLVNFNSCWTSTPRIANGFHTNLFEVYESFDKIEKYGAVMLFAHETDILNHAVYPPQK